MSEDQLFTIAIILLVATGFVELCNEIAIKNKIGNRAKSIVRQVCVFFMIICSIPVLYFLMTPLVFELISDYKKGNWTLWSVISNRDYLILFVSITFCCFTIFFEKKFKILNTKELYFIHFVLLFA